MFLLTKIITEGRDDSNFYLPSEQAAEQHVFSRRRRRASPSDASSVAATAVAKPVFFGHASLGLGCDELCSTCHHHPGQKLDKKETNINREAKQNKMSC